MKINKVYCEDNLQLIKNIPDDCIDMIAIDPPYGLKIMSKKWDKALPPLEIFQEMNRVLKPGAFCFVFSSPRQDLLWRMMQRLDDAGFEIDLPSIYWTYATGMGLGGNVSKMIDKRLGVEGELIREVKNSGIDKLRIKAGYRKVLPKPTGKRKPASDLAKEFDGAYIRYRPKSCLEIILVAMKPVEEKTYIEQVIKNGKACTWLDRVRVPLIGIEHHNAASIKKETCRYYGDMAGAHSTKERGQMHERYYDKGRYPTNLLVQDDLLNTGENHKSGKIEKHHNLTAEKTKDGGPYGKFAENLPGESYGDSGSYSRFFCFDSWARECLPKTYPFLPIAKPTAGHKKGREAHLTEKPPQIFAYLITLASRPGDIVADFFGGSGSCALAAAALNRDWIFCDIEEAHCEIARQRISRLTVQREERELI